MLDRRYKNIALNNQYVIHSAMEIICPFCSSTCKYTIIEGGKWNDKEIRYDCKSCYNFLLIYYPESFPTIDLTFGNYLWLYYYHHSHNNSYITRLRTQGQSFNDKEFCPNLLNLEPLISYIKIIEFYS